jgi:hypothetical protein
MYVFERMNEQLFLDAFASSETRRNQFSREALRVLFGFYDQLADDSQEPIQFDMVAICSEGSEMDAEELGEQFGLYPVGTVPNEKRSLSEQYDELMQESAEDMWLYVLPVEHYGEPTTYLVHESFSTSGR